MDWERKAREEKFKIRHFLYNGDFLATLIYMDVENEQLAVPFGWAHVSPKDQPSREKGRQIAYSRFLKAVNGEKRVYGGEPIRKNTPREGDTVIRALPDRVNKQAFQTPFGRFMGHEGSALLCNYAYHSKFTKKEIEDFIKEFNEKKYGKYDPRAKDQNDDMGNAL